MEMVVEPPAHQIPTHQPCRNDQAQARIEGYLRPNIGQPSAPAWHPISLYEKNGRMAC